MEENPEPKRRNAAKTRARILQAAYESFSVHGYANTGFREIAGKADVASSLIVRYFGNKAALFEEAFIHGIYANTIFTREKSRFGETMAKMLVREGDGNLTTMIVLALSDPESKDIALKVSKRHVIEPLADWLGPPNAYARALNMLTLLTGFAVQMRPLSMEQVPPASAKWLARALQSIVDET